MLPWPLRLVRASIVHPDAAFPEHFHHRSPVPWPDIPGEAEEVPAGFRLLGQEIGEAPVALPQIAAGAGADYVPARVVPPAHTRFDMVDRELVCGEDQAAVDAPVPVAGKECLARERGRPGHAAGAP